MFEQKYPLDSVLALDADNVVPNDEVVKEAETAVVEGEAVDFLEVNVDRKDEATLCDVVTEEVWVPAKGAPQTGWHVDRFPRRPGRMRLVSTPLWSLRPPTREPELWLIIGKAAQSEMRVKGMPTIVMHLPRRWSGARLGDGPKGPLVDGGGELPGV